MKTLTTEQAYKCLAPKIEARVSRYPRSKHIRSCQLLVGDSVVANVEPFLKEAEVATHLIAHSYSFLPDAVMLAKEHNLGAIASIRRVLKDGNIQAAHTILDMFELNTNSFLSKAGSVSIPD